MGIHNDPDRDTKRMMFGSSLNPAAPAFVPRSQNRCTTDFMLPTARNIKEKELCSLDGCTVTDDIETYSISSGEASNASTVLDALPRSRFKLALDTFTQCHSSTHAQFVEVPIIRGLDLLGPLVDAALSCNSHIAGGAVRWMCSPLKDPVPTADVDIFPPDASKLLALAARLQGMGYKRHATAHNQMALSFEHESLAAPAKLVQLVIPRKTAHLNTSAVGAEELLSKLDFTIARAAVIGTKRALVDADFMRDEHLRLLRVRHIVCPISCVRRIAKYSAKGYRCRMLEIMKLFAEWSHRAEAETAREDTTTSESTSIQQSRVSSPASAGLIEAGIGPSKVAGSSSGALVASLYAAGLKIDDFDTLTKQIAAAAYEVTPSMLLEAMSTNGPTAQERQGAFESGEILTGIYVD